MAIQSCWQQMSFSETGKIFNVNNMSNECRLLLMIKHTLLTRLPVTSAVHTLLTILPVTSAVIMYLTQHVKPYPVYGLCPI